MPAPAVMHPRHAWLEPDDQGPPHDAAPAAASAPHTPAPQGRDAAVLPGCGACGAPCLDPPLLLIPCGHVVCQRCQAGASSATLRCAVASCGRPVDAAAPDSGSIEALRLASAGLGPAPCGGAPLGPLHPELGALIRAACRPEQAEQAEALARQATSHRRLAALREQETELAVAETADAAASHATRRTVAGALEQELAALDAQMEALRVERAVVLSQLQEALQERSKAAARETIAQRRAEALREAAEAAVHDAGRCESMVDSLAPAIPLRDPRYQTLAPATQRPPR